MPLDALPNRLPTLLLRGLVVFPEMLLHFDVRRKKSLAAVQSAMKQERMIFLLAQRDIVQEDPQPQQIFKTGCVALIKQVVRLTDDSMRVLVEGLYRASYTALDENAHFWSAGVTPCEQARPRAGALYKQALLRKARGAFERYAAVHKKIPPDLLMTVMTAEDCGYLADYLASNLPVSLEEKQGALEECNPVKRLEFMTALLEREIRLLELERKISAKVHAQLEENQRDYFLREQLKVIQEELGVAGEQEELDAYADRIDALRADDAVKNQLYDEVEKLAKMPGGSHEATVVRNYLDACLKLPFGIYTKDRTDLERAEAVLEREHYGMKKVKARVLELFAVRQLKPDVTGQILCLVGPPGVGKTSIAKSIAACLGRKLQRISLGGIHDEAEIRGHRRTYIGAMQGKIMQAVAQAGSSNPVILLDEVDKLGADFKGDPAAALLEVLDGEQNAAFRDHYIDLPFDLSRVLFLTTANTTETIPAPLLDRMECIEVPSYTREDKFQIARRHLIAKQRKKHGIKAAMLRIEDGAVYALIDQYTREAGVRQLERLLASLCRKAAKTLVAAQSKSVKITAGSLPLLLGPPKYKESLLPQRDQTGLVNGLAWTSVGGELMQMEVVAVQGKGKLALTGSLGDVMQESARDALTYVRSRAQMLRINPDFYKTLDIHIHATETAVPKDGPSAGVTVATALVSALTDIPVRRDVAMTGEITLLGRVLPIGGLREKLMAAYRAGVRKVYIPSANQPDLEDVDPLVTRAVEILPVAHVDEILQELILQNLAEQTQPPQAEANCLSARYPAQTPVAEIGQ